MKVKKAKETNIKTYSLQSLIIIIFLLLIVSIVLTLIRSIKADEVVQKTKLVEKTIASLNKELSILKAEEAKYSAPNRFLEIGISSGEISPRGEDDIIYLKLQSAFEVNISEKSELSVVLEENIEDNIIEDSFIKNSKAKETVKKKPIKNETFDKANIKSAEKKENNIIQENINVTVSKENINSYEAENYSNISTENIIAE